MSKATQTQWRVQVQAKTGNWINRGLFETREHAREIARELRAAGWVTRVVRYEKAAKKC